MADQRSAQEYHDLEVLHVMGMSWAPCPSPSYFMLVYFEATDAKIYTKLYKGSFKVQKSTNTNADLADLPATTLCISLSTWGKYFNDYAIHVHKKGMVKTWKIA